MTDVDRRTVLAIGGAALTGTLAGCTGESEGPGGGLDGETEGSSDGGDSSSGGGDVDYVDEEPEYDGWFDDVDNYEGTVDYRGRDEVTISNGAGSIGQRFDPPAIAVDAGTIVTWEWTGEGGAHDVTADDESFQSDLTDEEGHTFSQTFDEDGVHEYYCSPHVSVGMKGAVVVR